MRLKQTICFECESKALCFFSEDYQRGLCNGCITQRNSQIKAFGHSIDIDITRCGRCLEKRFYRTGYGWTCPFCKQE